MVSWMIRGPVPEGEGLVSLAPAMADADAGPFLALRPLDRIALEPGTTIVTTEFPRALLADWDCPYLPIGRASRCARKCCIPATASRSPFACSTEIPVKGTTMMKRTLFVAIAAAFTLLAFAAHCSKAQKHYFTYSSHRATASSPMPPTREGRPSSGRSTASRVRPRQSPRKECGFNHRVPFTGISVEQATASGSPSREYSISPRAPLARPIGRYGSPQSRAARAEIRW